MSGPYAATGCHTDLSDLHCHLRPLRVMSGSVVLQQVGSVIMSKVCVITTGYMYVDVQVLR